MQLNHRAIARAAQFIADADAIIIAAGAGMGVDSGLPDFRGNAGFWKAYPALAAAQINFTSIASPAAFHENVNRAWAFYGHRLALYRNTLPHTGFHLLRDWGEQKAFGYQVFTSNVDGQFERAGFARDSIYECHGSIHHLQCLDNCCNAIWPASDFAPQVDEAQCRLLNEPPTCPFCGGYARPNILMFGDWGWIDERSNAQEMRQSTWLAQVRQPVVIELGAGVDIATVRYFSQTIVDHYNGHLIRINPREAQVDSSRAIGIASGALKALQAIHQQLT
jgi:NAD-dependent SIR2 family protein deacetylase